MALLEVIFVVGLLFEVGNTQEQIYLYSQPGKDVTLPCGRQDQPQQCSNVSWLFNRDSLRTFTEAQRGEINQRSPRADRMSLGIDCSLSIKTVTAVDVGRFTCRQDGQQDVNVHLSLLNISPKPADFDPKRDDELSLECSLMRYRGFSLCLFNPLHWVDETGATITEGVKQNHRGSDCFSYLKVKRQSGNHKKFTCRVLNNNKVEIEADFTPSFNNNRAGSSQEQIDLYSQPGKDVTLLCGRQNQPQQCSDVFWVYNRDLSGTTLEAERGEINQRSPRADRMSLGIDCSLSIKTVTAEDVGRFTCQQGGHPDVNVHLNLLSISPEPADWRFECSLMRFRGLSECRLNTLHWVDETGATITEGVEQNPIGADCFSYLKVKRQSGNNRKFTCQVLNNEENKVEIEADYTPFLRDPAPEPTQGPGVGPGSDSGPGPGSDSKLIFIIVGVLAGVVLFLIIMAVLLIKHKKRDKVADVLKPTQQPDDPESSLTYVTVNHSKQQTYSNIRGVNEEAVTYSTVKSAVKMGKDDDPSSFYSTISKN